MPTVYLGLLGWAAFWGCVEVTAAALMMLRILSLDSNVVPFAFAMAVLALPVGGLVAVARALVLQ